MEHVPQPFEFRQCSIILRATGRKARSLGELRIEIQSCSDNSLLHHMSHYLLKAHAQEYTNDFAHWTGETLEERSLAERLANIDPYGVGNVQELRLALLVAIDTFLEVSPEPRLVRSGEEFFFNETLTVVCHAGFRSRNLAEFVTAIRHIGPESIYFHFLAARQRNDSDDFSNWLNTEMNKMEIAERIRGIDPFVHGIEDIRNHIVDCLDAAVRHEIEEVI